jgi:glucoamylase
MPLVWAHSEFIKLCYGHVLGRPVDRPEATWARYGGVRPVLDYEIWGPGFRPRRLRAGQALTVALTAEAVVHWGVGDWSEVADVETHDTGLGIHAADLPVRGLSAGTVIRFTFRWRATGTWEGENYEVTVTA